MVAMAGLLSLAFVTPATAQGVGIDAGASDSLGDVSGGPSDRWRYTLGLGAVAVPDYEGSDEYEARPLPIARIQKGHQYGQLFGTKITSNLVPHPNFRLGPVINYRGERDDVDNSAVDKMSDVDAALELGVQAGYDHKLDGGVIGAEVEWVHDVADGHDGWLLTPEIHYRRPFGDRWKFNLAVSTTWVSDDYMETYFSVTPSDSAKSGLPVFGASDGFKDVGVAVALAYSFNDHWGAGALGSWKRLLNDAEDSPVTKVGDENQFIAGLFVTYAWMGN
jgi:outer membrane protein